MKRIVCEQCGKEATRKSVAIYCSQGCNYIAYKVRNPSKVMYNRTKQRALKRNIPFTLTLETMPKIPTHCPVLGTKLEQVFGIRSGSFPSSPSIDRLNPTLGYIEGNVRVISQRANHLKSNATVEELEKVLIDARLCV